MGVFREPTRLSRFVGCSEKLEEAGAATEEVEEEGDGGPDLFAGARGSGQGK